MVGQTANPGLYSASGTVKTAGILEYVQERLLDDIRDVIRTPQHSARNTPDRYVEALKQFFEGLVVPLLDQRHQRFVGRKECWVFSSHLDPRQLLARIPQR